MKIIIHFSVNYLNITKNWLYNQIKYLENEFNTIIITEYVENLDLFKLNNCKIHCKRKILNYPLNFLDEVLKKFFLHYSIHTYLFINKIKKKSNNILCHVHFGDEAIKQMPLINKLKIPLIVSFYGFDISILPQKEYWKKRFLKLFSSANLFLAEGENMKKTLIDLGCPENKIKIYHLGIEVNKIDFKIRTLNTHEKVKFLMIARFSQKKGIIFAIQAFSIVKKKYSNCELIIIGDGEMRKEIEELIISLRLQQDVKLLGYQLLIKTKEYLFQSHIFLCPSVTASNGDTEGGLPVALIEAIASGMPVIGSRHADIPEVIVNEQNGFLINEKDVNALADYMIFLCNNSKLWEKMGNIGRKFVTNNYDINRQKILLKDIYLNTINQWNQKYQ